MCVILFALNPNSKYRLIVAANRDEYHARDTRPATYWDDEGHSDMLAGKDLEGKGTWLGICTNNRGRFAAVTNVFCERNDEQEKTKTTEGTLLSRGELPLNFLTQSSTNGKTDESDYINNDDKTSSSSLSSSSSPSPSLATRYVESIYRHANQYRPFNLIIIDDLLSGMGECYYFTNQNSSTIATPAGKDGENSGTCIETPRILPNHRQCYGLSNGVLNDAKWSKAIKGRDRLANLVISTDVEAKNSDIIDNINNKDDHEEETLITELFNLLSNPGDGQLENSFFVQKSDAYGTRASTVILVGHDGMVTFEERNFGPGGITGVCKRYQSRILSSFSS